MFWGSFPAKIDEKSRLRLPAKFRQLTEEGNDTFFVTSVNGEFALIYPWAAWEKIAEKLRQSPGMSDAIQKYLRITGFYGLQTETDPQGRILIPQKLREKAKISGDVMVIGAGDHMEVWNDSIVTEDIDANPLTKEDRAELSKMGI
jgi:MraZ protein